MPTYDVDVEGVTYEVDAPNPDTAWQWANYTHRQKKATQAAAPKPEGGFFPALKAGAIELGGGISALAGKLGLKEEAAAQAEYEAAKKRAGEVFKGTEKGWTEDPVTKFLETLGGSVPYMALPAAAGAAALALPATVAATPVLGGLTTLGTAAGLGAAGLTSAAQFTATNLSRQLEEGKKLAETDLGAAALAAVPQAALDTLSMRMIPGIGRMFGQAGIKITAENAKEIAEQGLKKTLIDYTAKTGKTAGIEGATEAAQQVFERLQAGLSITDPEARKEYFDSFLGGAVLGGALAPAGRFVERGKEQKEAGELLTAKAAEEKKAARAAEEAEKAKPEYALKLEADYQAAVARMKELQAAVPKRPAKDALPEEQMAYKEAVEARNTHLKEVLQPLAAEYMPRKAEIAQLKERQRVEGLTPLEYQMEQAGVDLTAPPKEERVFTGEEELPAAPAPEVAYAQQQMDLAKQQDLGTFEATDFVDYLMQDPAMAQRLVETQTPIPGVSKKESAAILSGLKLQLTEQAKQQAKQTREATQAELQQRQADLAAQQQVEPADPLAMWKASLEETEDQATEELLRPNFEAGLTPSGPAMVTVAPGIKPIQRPEQLLRRIDELTATRDQATADADTAFAAGNKELGVKKSQEREAAQTALNNLEQDEGTPRALLSLRKAQDTALMNAAQLIDDLRVGRTLGGPEAATASSTPQTLINQINKQRDAFITAAIQEAAAIRRLYAKGLTQDEAVQAANQMRDVFNEWVTRSMAQPVTDVNWVDRLVAEANARGAVAGKSLKDAPWVQQMKQDFIRAQMTDALTKRLGRQRMEEIAKGTAELKGAETELPPDTRRAIESKAAVDFDKLLTAAQEKALAQSTDPRPLEERRFGSYRAATAVLQEQLQGIASTLKQVTREFRRETPLLKMQFPETEAAKVAEERGETAQTLEGELRRRRDYVNTQIEQAFQTRKVPGIAQTLLTRAQDFISQAPRSFLDAAENLTSRILRGQNIERGDLVTMLDELRAASARPGEAEVVGERAKQKELFPAGERREDLGLIREKPAVFEAARGKEAAKAARATAAAERSEKLTQSIKEELDRIDAERVAALEERVTAGRDSLQSAWQSAVKKAKTLVVKARKAAAKDKVKALRDEINAIYKGGLEGLNKETIDRFLAARQALADIDAQVNEAVEAAEFLPIAKADTWVAFERGALEQAEKALAETRTPQTVSAAQQQRAALQRAEQARLQSLKGEEKAAEAARMRAAQTGLGLPGQRRVAGRVEAIEPEQTAAQRAAEAEERRQQIQKESAQRAAEKEAERSELEQRVLDLGTQVADREAAQQRARTPASKAKIQEEIDAINKDLTFARGQLEALGEAKPRKKGPATVATGAALARQRPLRTGTGANIVAEELRAQSEAQRRGATKLEASIEREQRVLRGEITAKGKTRAPATRVQALFEEAQAPSELSSFSIGKDDIFFSRGPTSDPSTADSLRTELKQTFPDLGRVQIYDSVDALVAANPQYEGKIPSDARGFVDTAGNKAFLIAENVNKGDGLSVLLHEVGAHIGLKNALGDAQYNTLVNAVKSWEKKADGSKESQVAQAARARVEAAETTAGQVNDELLAYAIEEAVKAGVKPTETKGVLGQWLSRVAALFRKALEKFGLPPKALDAQGLVDMAFGAAKMEMSREAAPAEKTKTAAFERWFGDSKVVDENGKPLVVYHGSSADITEFRSPADRGEGAMAQAGLYFTQDRDFANIYGMKGAVYPVYLSIKNPLDLTVEYPANSVRGRLLKLIAPRVARALTQENELRNRTNQALITADERAELQALGYDGIKAPGGVWIAFAPTQIKSATGNRGTYDPTSPDILFSRNLPTAARVANQIVGEQKGWFQGLKDNFLGMGGRAQFVDKLAPIEEALKRGGVDQTKALQAMYYLRMYDQRMHFTSQAITDGVPEIVEKARKDGETERLIETKPGANISQIVDILKRKDVVKAAGSPDAANKLFTLYLAAIRAKRVGLDALNFGKGLTQADLDAAMAEIEANDTLKDAFNEARDIYIQYNRNLVDFAVQTGALSKDEANRLLRNNDYIPYYRMRGGVAELIIGNETPIRIGNLKDSPHLKELVGGDEPIMDFLTSSVQNTSMMLDMAMKNLATKNAMFELRDVGLAKIAKTPKKGAPEGSVTFKRDGEDYFAVVDTDTIGISGDLLVKGMAGIPTMFPAFVRLFGMPARFLRRAVVASPVYMARQLFRDTLAATLTSGADIVPVLGALNQIGKPDALKNRGITGGQVFTGMPEDMTRMLKEMQAGKVSVTSGLAWLEAKSAQLDALTRRNQYDSYIKQGLSEMEATYMALESMNFSKRGLSPSLHMASTLIPFFNAQIQGLDVLYKAFTGKMPMNEKLNIRQKLWTWGLLLAGASMVYALAMQDDEAYKNAKPEEKYGNWFVRLPGVDEPLRLPIPFELGYVFKALPEAIVNTLVNDKGGEEALKAGKHIVQQMIPGASNYFLPQAVKPALETILNKSFYTGRDIESAQERMVEAGYRYRDNTTQIARELGELTGFSPIQMENLVRGYTGSMGMVLLQALSFAMPSGGPEKAYKRLSEQPLIGTLFQPNDARGIIDATYERMKEVQEVQNTYKDLLKKGRPDDARKYAEEKSGELALASVAGNFRQVMGELSTYERQVRAAPAISAERKREILDRIRQQQIRIATSARQIFDRSKPQAVPA